MNKIDKFFDKASLWKVFPINVLISILFMGIIFIGLSKITGENPYLFNGIIIKVGIAMGIVFGGLLTLLISENRKSNRFWEYSKEVGTLIENAKSKKELENIHNNEFQKLVSMAFAGHIHEIKRLKTIMETSYKFLN
jgi:hypothetical protein